jgi:phosphoserine phosphatase
MRSSQGLPADATLPELQFLSLSGGGENGAFGAGLLCGWSPQGTRPMFELVTGISTGALIAPFAFLGRRLRPAAALRLHRARPERCTDASFLQCGRSSTTQWLTTAGGYHALIEIAATTHSGMTTDKFEAQARKWLATARHPQINKLFTAMVFHPMLELLAYLRANGFKTFIVSGGGVEFMRAIAEITYGVPPEHVIGSSGSLKLEMRDGEPVLVKLHETDVINDTAEKPAAIQKHIDRRPIAAFGNSDGDLEMLQWTTAGKGARFALLVP